MNSIKVKLHIDATNLNHTAALATFFNALSKDGSGGNISAEIQDCRQDFSQATTIEPEKKQPASRSKKKTEDIEVKAEEVIVKTELKASEKIETVPQSGTVTAELLREVLSEKVINNRDVIKEKFTVLGAQNVSTLDPSYYEVFLEFLNSL
jgi:hypothetical protein